MSRGANDLDTAASLAEAHLRLGNHGEARSALCQRLPDAAPKTLDALMNAGEILACLGAPAAAYECVQSCLSQALASQRAAVRIAKLLVMLRRHEEAIELCRRFAPSPTSPFTPIIAEALANTGQYDQAFELLGLALERRPAGDLYHLRSLLWSRVRNPERACADLDAALEMAPNDAVFQFAKALVLVRMGRWQEAWPYWEARWRRPDFWHRPEFDLAMMASGGCAGKHVLVYWEQGIGDTILFSRFITTLAERGAMVTLRCQDGLARLLRSVQGVARIAPPHIEPVDYDACIPLLSLPAMVALTPETVPQRVPYVCVDEPTAGRWRQVLDGHQGFLKVGLVWQGNPRQGDDERRSVPLELLGPLASVQNVRFFSLQKGVAAHQIRDCRFGPGIVDLAADIDDFADTAAVVQQLDLVVCVDTAVAHVAGALGRRVWILLAYGAGPLWMLDRGDTPFYPTAVLFRQPAPGAWAPAIAAIRQRLSELVRHSADWRSLSAGRTEPDAPRIVS